MAEEGRWKATKEETVIAVNGANWLVGFLLGCVFRRWGKVDSGTFKLIQSQLPHFGVRLSSINTGHSRY